MSGTFHIKNFDRLQHYKDRSPPWIKLYNGLLDDYEFARLPDASKAHLIAIGLLASRYSNKIPLDADWIARRINATTPVDLDALIKSGFVIPDQVCSDTLALCLQDARPERERETQERDRETTTTTVVVAADFDLFFKEMPKSVNKLLAREAFKRAVERSTSQNIIQAARRYRVSVKGFEDRYILSPAKWLDDSRWEDFPTNGGSAFTNPEELANQQRLKEKYYGEA